MVQPHLTLLANLRFLDPEDDITYLQALGLFLLSMGRIRGVSARSSHEFLFGVIDLIKKVTHRAQIQLKPALILYQLVKTQLMVVDLVKAVVRDFKVK